MGNITKELAKYRIMSQFKDKNSCLSYLMLQPGKPRQWMKEQDFICSEFEFGVHIESIAKTDEFSLRFYDYDSKAFDTKKYIDFSSISETDNLDVYIEKITINDSGAHFEVKPCHFYGIDYEYGLEYNATIDGLPSVIELDVANNQFRSQRFSEIRPFIKYCTGIMGFRDSRYICASTSPELLQEAKKAKWIKELPKDKQKTILALIKKKTKRDGDWYMNVIIRGIQEVMVASEQQSIDFDSLSFRYVKPGGNITSWTYEER